jgi:hypothetical protein
MIDETDLPGEIPKEDGAPPIDHLAEDAPPVSVDVKIPFSLFGFLRSLWR